MKGQIKFIKKVLRGVMYIIKLEEGFQVKTFTGEKYKNYKNWKGFKKNDWVGGLRWVDKEKIIIDADSPVRLIKPQK